MPVKKINLFYILFLLVLSIFSSCKNDIPELTLTEVNTDTIPSTDVGNCNPDTVYFQNTILPIFVSNCAQTGCHNTTSHSAGIKLNNYLNIINTGDIEAFNPYHGNITDVISTSNPDNKMPPSTSGLASLSGKQISSIIKWINQGALNNFCDACDTSNVTYSKSVAPVIAAKCKGCHQGSNPGGGISLVSFSDVFGISIDGSLLGCVNHSNGYNPMPKGSNKLPDCDIAKIRIWINDGSPAN